MIAPIVVKPAPMAVGRAPRPVTMPGIPAIPNTKQNAAITLNEPAADQAPLCRPARGLADLDELVSGMQNSGLPLRVDIRTGDPLPSALSPLSPRELQVFDLLARGSSNAQIAQRLFLSEATVKTHVAQILAKLSIRDRVQAVVLAYETGYLRAGSAHRPGTGSGRGSPRIP